MSPGSSVSERAAKSAEELAIVCTQLPKLRCDALVGITLRFERYSHYEKHDIGSEEVPSPAGLVGCGISATQ